MTGTGPTVSWRRRVLMSALVLMGALAMAPGAARDARTDDGTQLTLLYHGAVTGKIAPCG